MAAVRVTGKVKRIEDRSGKLDNGDRWANKTVTVIVNDEATAVKFREDAVLGFAEGDIIDLYCDAFKPSLKFTEHVIDAPAASKPDQGKRSLQTAV